MSGTLPSKIDEACSKSLTTTIAGWEMGENTLHSFQELGLVFVLNWEILIGHFLRCVVFCYYYDDDSTIVLELIVV